jgi:hypothetical protein
MNSEFENQLQRQPLREIPPHWRSRIIAAAQPAPSRWHEWFQPWPQAWKALGAAWVVIFFLHFTTPDEPRLAGHSYPPPSYAVLQQQEMMMAQLLSSTDGDERPAALPHKSKPRTERERGQFNG